MKENQQTPVPDLISAYQFAARKNVSNTSVYRKIEKGEIETINIGKYQFIDWDKFKHVDFPHATRINDSKAARIK